MDELEWLVGNAALDGFSNQCRHSFEFAREHLALWHLCTHPSPSFPNPLRLRRESGRLRITDDYQVVILIVKKKMDTVGMHQPKERGWPLHGE